MTRVRHPVTGAGDFAAIERRVRGAEAKAARSPLQTVAVEIGNLFQVITSGTFVPTCFSNLPFLQNPVLNVWVVVTADVGTSAEVRLHEFYGGGVTDTITVAGGGPQFCVFEWLHGVHLLDTGAEFRVNVRRSAGAGNVNAYAPRRFAFGTIPQFPDADDVGNPMLL